MRFTFKLLGVWGRGVGGSDEGVGFDACEGSLDKCLLNSLLGVASLEQRLWLTLVPSLVKFRF